MALNIAEKGFPISVHNRSNDKVDAAEERAKKSGSNDAFVALKFVAMFVIPTYLRNFSFLDSSCDFECGKLRFLLGKPCVQRLCTCALPFTLAALAFLLLFVRSVSTDQRVAGLDKLTGYKDMGEFVMSLQKPRYAPHAVCDSVARAQWVRNGPLGQEGGLIPKATLPYHQVSQRAGVSYFLSKLESRWMQLSTG